MTASDPRQPGGGVELSASSKDVGAVLRRFDLLPARHSGKVVEVEFIVGQPRSAFAAECGALRLPLGATLSSHVRLEPGGEYFYVYASDALAEEFLNLAKGTLIRVRAKTVYGVDEARSPEDGDQECKGLVLQAILAVTTPPPS